LHNIKSPYSVAPQKGNKKCQVSRITQSHQEVHNVTMRDCTVVQLQTITDLIAYKYLDPLETDLELSKKIGCLQY